jgi:hypothetical protein
MSIHKEDFDELKLFFCSKITEKVLRGIISDIPPEWSPSSRDIDALIEYLLYRIDHIEDICITISNYISG